MEAVKTTAFDLQLNLSSPGLRLHRLERPRDHLLVTGVDPASEFLEDLKG
jgi:hypothetical protein